MSQLISQQDAYRNPEDIIPVDISEQLAIGDWVKQFTMGSGEISFKKCSKEEADGQVTYIDFEANLVTVYAPWNDDDLAALKR